MKKILFFVAMLSFAVNTAHAQLREEPYDYMDLVVGGKIGASAATLTKLGGDYKMFPYGSFYAELYLSQKISMALEVSYSRKGTNGVIVREQQIIEELRFDEDGNPRFYFGEEYPYDYDIDYLNTSYLFKYHPIPMFNVYTGLCLSRILSAKAKVADQSTKIRDLVNSGDFSVPNGVELLLGKRLTIDGRWNWSPRHISKDEKSRRLLGRPCNNFFSVTVGYKMQVL